MGGSTTDLRRHQMPAARVFPSGLNATEYTHARGAGQGLAEPGGAGRVGHLPQPDLVVFAAGGQGLARPG